MTSENLLKFLDNREYLHQVSYQELKTLVIQYPYSLSLRYLLGMKSHQENNQDLDRNTELLSTYGIDRAHLFKVFNENSEVLEELEQSILIQEDFLELKELSALEREIDEKTLTPTANDLTFLINKQSSSFEENGITQSKVELDQEINTEKIAKENGFYVMDFEEGENIKDSNKAIVSQSGIGIKAEHEVFEENGLPPDAIEITDLYESNQEEKEKDFDPLFTTTEEEITAEEAISDSISYIENPEDVLKNESKLSTTIESEENKQVETQNLSKIPFEIIHSEQNPNINTEIPLVETNIIEESQEEATTLPQKQEENKIEEQLAPIKFEKLNQTVSLLKLQKDNSSTQSNKKIKTPSPKKMFSSWNLQSKELHQFSGINFISVPISSSIGNTIKRKKIKNPINNIKGKFKNTVAFAEKSLKMGENIASETLADLLAEQGHYKKATAMYKQLCLIMPEKSGFFAGEIEKIQNLKDKDS